jgi:RimJ/RimL family protein N-acetyltransferase
VADVILRDVEPGDLPVFFAQQCDPGANAAAGVPARDRDSFDAHWARVLADDNGIVRTIVAGGAVVGNVVSWEESGRRLVGYWLGREHWGRGLATEALAAFLDSIAQRPLHALVSRDNPASLRVLEKCGFEVRSTERGEDGVTEVRLELR